MADRKDAAMVVNSNFHHVAGEDLFAKEDERFKEYRRNWKEWPERFEAGSFPLFIDVEVTSSCNLKCPFCATTFRKNAIRNGFMSFDIMKKIVDEGAANGLYGVKFNMRGEPLLHPQIVDFVRYAKEKALIDVYFNTNAMLLTEEMSKKLIDARLDRISVSFEGYTKDVYESHRVGANYETVLFNIELMQRLKRELRSPCPRVRVQTVLSKELEPSFEDYKKFWTPRSDEVGFLDYKEMKTKKRGIRYGWACPQLWQRMAVWWDGTILPCNHDDEGTLALGNVNEMNIKDAWNSKLLKTWRMIHRSGRAHEIPACDGCYLRDSEIAKLKEREIKR